MSSTLSFYEQNANQLMEQYQSVAFERVHQSWQSFWPLTGDKVLDVGAGSGRDAKWMAEQGCEVIAIEPCHSLRELGNQFTGHSVTWLDDALLTLDESLWDCFRLYHAWIEPLVVNQWIMEMQRFSRNQERNITLQTYHDCLVWLDKVHDTKDVRSRVDELRVADIDVRSVWSGSSLAKGYHVDHCLPFAHWPNNDRWNLVPTTAKENLDKKDRLPAKKRLSVGAV